MAKNHTLLAMLTGAALAGGIIYLKRRNEQMAAPEGEAPDRGRIRDSFKITIDGEEYSGDEARARFKEEAGKALNNFKESAKSFKEELTASLQKSFEDLKTSLEETKKQAEENSIIDGDDLGDIVEEAADELKEVVEDVVEEAES